MRTRLLVTACLSVAVAGCGTSALHTAPGQTSSSAATAAPAHASPSRAVTPAAGSSPACKGSQAATVGAGSLTGLQFVSATQGWAVGQGAILATSDGGAHWTAQLTGNLNLTSLDFISARDGWAVGTTTLLATTDGGAHWTALPEPCQTIRSVHFISPSTGYAVAGGQGLSGQESPVPPAGGVVLSTGDGGRTWHPMPAPSNAQSVCFSDPRHGWLGAGGLLYRSANGGKTWTALTGMAGQVGSGGPATMDVECANDGTAWALRTGPGAAMSQDPHVGYYANQAGATPIFAEQYFQTQGAQPHAQSPGPDAGPFSAIDSASAAFIDGCEACGPGTAPWDIATNSGATLTKEGNVGSITQPQAASFQSPQAGWVAGTDTVLPASGSGVPRTQERIVATTNGGRTWHVEWSGPWTS